MSCKHERVVTYSGDIPYTDGYYCRDCPASMEDLLKDGVVVWWKTEEELKDYLERGKEYHERRLQRTEA